jgi:hypothetical protein
MEILHDLDLAFESDPAIDEIGFMFGYEDSNMVVVEHKLGISTKCLKKLFKYASSTLRDTVVGKRDRIYLKADEVLRLTRAILIVRADNPLALCLRKELLQQKFLDYSQEISFLNILFPLHPKSPSCWEHRRWVLKQKYASALPINVIESELTLSAHMSHIYPRNYYSWLHRIWLLLFLPNEKLIDEVVYMRSWMSTHTSDYSATSYQILIIQKLLSCNASTPRSISLLQEELDCNRQLLYSYSNRENLWLQRRALFSRLIDTQTWAIDTHTQQLQWPPCTLTNLIDKHLKHMCMISDGVESCEGLDTIVSDYLSCSSVTGAVFAELMTLVTLLEHDQTVEAPSQQQRLRYLLSYAVFIIEKVCCCTC